MSLRIVAEARSSVWVRAPQGAVGAGNAVKILLVPYCYLPDPIGGTEVYVSTLARNLNLKGEQALITAPSKNSAAYTINDIRVRRFAASDVLSLPQLYGFGDPIAATEFEKIIEEEQPDIVHLHAFTAAVSTLLVRAIKRRGIPVIFTYHTPTISCERGTMMRWGTDVCNGALNTSPCSACTLHSLGLNRPIANLIGELPPAFGAILERLRLRSGPWTALQMTRLTEIRHAAFHTLLKEADHIVAVCNWVREVLIINEAPSHKVSVSRQGIEWDQDAVATPFLSSSDGELKVAFVGRLDATKGLHVLIKAVRLSSRSNIMLDIYGVVQNETNLKYSSEMKRLAAGDRRIAFKEPVPSGQVVSIMRAYDIVAVPSQWLETGPLVVLEAFAAGAPIIGSNIGGIAELVRDGENGLLVERSVEEAWSKALDKLASTPALRRKLKAGVRPPRTGSDVADDMISLYRCYGR